MMQQALVIAIIAAISCGALLLYISVADNLLLLSLYLVLGGLAVVAAITYTMGASPYGYSGLGDLAVFVFFGLAAVVGGNVLFSHQFQPLILLPATFCGLLCVLVLNVNNLRDLTNDKRIGKNTLAVRLGHKNTIRYHVLLLVVAQSCAVIYIIVAQLPPLTWLHLLALPLLIKSTAKLVHFNNGEIMNQQLKMTVMSTFLYCSLFSLGFIV